MKKNTQSKPTPSKTAGG
jgi:DnaJ family protein B protein 6